jgi:O-antigen ligase
MNRRDVIKATLLLGIESLFLYEFILHRQSFMFREFESYLLSLQWMLLACLAVWCGIFLFLTFCLNDLALIGFLLIAVAAIFINYATRLQATDAITLLAGVTLGKGVRFALVGDSRWQNGVKINILEIRNSEFGVRNFLIGLVLLLSFSSWWHLDLGGNYHGPRWMGLWNNPNDYGLLMAAGLILAIGLLAAKRHKRHKEEAAKRNAERGKTETIWKFIIHNSQFAILLVAVGMMVLGLLFSYSRGAWIGIAIGLLYLANAYGKVKWLYVLTGFGLLALGILLFWNHTPDNAPWYLKRADLSRPSAQHRVAAWKAGFEIMRDHPFGVGWNNTAEVYRKNYSLLEDGAGAIVTNDYLMLGTQLGLPGLICFVAYVALCFRRNRPHLTLTLSPPAAGSGEGIRIACRAGALAMLVAFWFDGGLFKLATASVFWILLELSQIRSAECVVRNQTNLS